MKSLLNKISVSLLLVPALTLGLSFAMTPVAGAACNSADLTLNGGANCAQGSGVATSLFDGNDSLFTKVVNIMLFLVGAIAVIMLIYGGIRYVTSGGAQDQVTAAKSTIMYAIVGIVVAILAYAVVNFVVNGLKTTP